MKTLFLMCLAVTAIATAQSKEVNVTGKWTMALEMAMGTATPTLDLKQDGEKLSGTYSGRYCTCPFTGKIKDRVVSFSFKMSAEGQEVEMSFIGEVAPDGATMKGSATLGEAGDATWTAKRVKT